MMGSQSNDATLLRRKTRIVCVSDTHNQTPKLPPGDVLIHAGDLTNQGSYSELKKTVRWLEKADFEAKIVIAGNHEITLDTPFYEEHASHWKWPEPQDSALNRSLLTDSSSITYLENSHATIYLSSPKGPRTCFKVFGSPCQPNQRRWAFRYSDAAAAEAIWSKIEDDTDIVVTHTPAEGLLDKPPSGVDFRCGCPVLLERLSQVRPMLHVCGHIHDGRGVGRVQWRERQPGGICVGGAPIEAVEYWKDPGAGNGKLSLVDLSRKSGRPLRNTGRWTRHAVPDSLDRSEGCQPDAESCEECQPGEDESKSTSRQGEFGPCVRNEAGKWRRTRGGAIELRVGSDGGGDGAGQEDRAEEGGRGSNAVDEQRKESVMINAALLGGRVNGKAKTFNKPIVVDIELPVWGFRNAE